MQQLLALWQNRLVQQIFRFAVVGGLAFVVDFGLLLFLTEQVGLNYLVSATISFVASVIVNYILSITWVFTANKHKKASVFQIVMFFVLSTCGLFINNAIMWFSVEILAISYVIGKLVATFVVMGFNFVTRKILIEGRKHAKTVAAIEAEAAALTPEELPEQSANATSTSTSTSSATTTSVSDHTSSN